MLLTLTTTHQPATDLGYLLRKNPARPQSFNLTFGKAHVFYPEATKEKCTVAFFELIFAPGLSASTVRIGRAADNASLAAKRINVRLNITTSKIKLDDQRRFIIQNGKKNGYLKILS